MSYMKEIINKLYHLIDESLPVIPLEHEAEKALEQTLTAEQWILFEEYQMEAFRNTEAERMQLFRRSLSLGRKLSRI